MGITVIVGGGCAGALAAIHLLRHTDDRVLLVEPGERLGPGVAYGTSDRVHLLNARSGAMSALADEPDHFAAWSRSSPGSFQPRASYGTYLEETLGAAETGRLRWIRASAQRILPGRRSTVVLHDGSLIRGDRTVLALGDAPPATHPVAALHPTYVDDPWRSRWSVPRDQPVLLLGTGLTAVDVALSLISRGHHAPIVALSRHGLLPTAHTADATPPEPPRFGPAPLRDLMRVIRRESAGRDWRPVVDGLRPHVNHLWQGLSPADRLRFGAHVGRFWEVHRHRLAPVVSAAVERLCRSGALTVAAGRLVGLTDPFTVRVATPDGRCSDWPAGAIVNCTGPGDPATIPLLAGLLAEGSARPSGYGIGLDVDADGRVIGADGRPTPGLTAIGPTRRGRWLETTAVPEIRAQAAALATGPANRLDAAA